jgi:hypothetical protein
MLKSRPQPPRPDRRRSIRGSFSWIDHRFLREGFDEGLTRLEKLLYFVLVAVSNQDGVSFYSDARLAELLDIRFAHELEAARNELVARDLLLMQTEFTKCWICPPTLPGKRVMLLPRCLTTLRARVPLSRPCAEPHCGRRLRIWKASSSCWNAGAGGVDETLRGLSAFSAQQRLPLSLAG